MKYIKHCCCFCAGVFTPTIHGRRMNRETVENSVEKKPTKIIRICEVNYKIFNCTNNEEKKQTQLQMPLFRHQLIILRSSQALSWLKLRYRIVHRRYSAYSAHCFFLLLRVLFLILFYSFIFLFSFGFRFCRIKLICEQQKQQ